MPFTSAQLRSELTTDPKALGYAPLLANGNDAGLADLLNTVGLSKETCAVSHVPMANILIAIGTNRTEWNTLSVQDCLLMLAVALVGVQSGVALNDPQVDAVLSTFFPASGGTATALDSMKTQQASRAEALFGDGTFITPSDIAQALLG